MWIYDEAGTITQEVKDDLRGHPRSTRQTEIDEDVTMYLHADLRQSAGTQCKSSIWAGHTAIRCDVNRLGVALF